MIPYFNIDRIPAIPTPFGDFQVHVFGFLVACGILVGSKLTRDRGRELGLQDEMVASMITTVLICGFLFSHFFDVFAYQLAGEPVTWKQWLWPFSGISSYGGFIGAVGGLFLWSRYEIALPLFDPKPRFARRDTPEPVMPYADSLGYGLAAGWAFGRMGCFTAYDHPGRVTTFFLGETYLDGTVRHNLGLEEALWAWLITFVFFIMKKRGKQPLGIYVSILVLGYGPVRFLLDFLRATDVRGADPRYFGLTPGHYLSIATIIIGGGLLRWTIMNARAEKARTAAAAEAPPEAKPKGKNRRK
jgi:phosphatidylglycerol:prolipoprotein diacylglycerol transferase